MAKQTTKPLKEELVVETLVTENPVVEVPIEDKTELPPPIIGITAESIVETTIIEEQPIVEDVIPDIAPAIFEASIAAETIEDISNPVKARIAELEEMLKWKWSGWRTQKLKKELENLKSSM